MSINSTKNFFRNHSKRVYNISGKIRRGQSPSPTESFKKEQELIAIARNLQINKHQLKRASSPTPSSLRERKKFINKTKKIS